MNTRNRTRLGRVYSRLCVIVGLFVAVFAVSFIPVEPVRSMYQALSSIGFVHIVLYIMIGWSVAGIPAAVSTVRTILSNGRSPVSRFEFISRLVGALCWICALLTVALLLSVSALCANGC